MKASEEFLRDLATSRHRVNRFGWVIQPVAMATEASIDTIANRLRHVASRGSDRDALLTLAEFLERCDLVESGFLLDPELCTGINLKPDGFVISFGSTHIRFKKTIGRWLVSESQDATVKPAHTHECAVFASGAPFSFLQGIEFAFGCMGSMGQDPNYYRHRAYSAVAVSSECEEKNELLSKEIATNLSLFHTLSQHVDEHKRELARKPFVEVARSRCVISLADGTAMPDPPSETMKLMAAKASLKGVSGIYFLWNGDCVEYVGRADNISRRLSGHGYAKEHHYVSAIEMSVPDSWIHEPYYIWLCRPQMNGNVQTAEKIRSCRAKTSRLGKTTRQPNERPVRAKGLAP